MPQKFKNCLYFTYWGIFLASGTSLLSSLFSSKNLLSLVFLSTLAPKWPILVSQCGMDHQKSTTSNQILPSFRTEVVEDRNFNQIQWLYKYILCCTFWFQRPCKCKCYFDYHILSPIILWLNPEEIPIKTIFSCWETGSFLIQKRGLPLLVFLFN